VELDHIILGVRDLELAAKHLEHEYGLTTVVGGTHPHWGTANRIAPLGDWYLELLGVVDDRVAAASDVGRWVAAGVSDHGAPIGWALRPEDLDATSERLGLSIHDGVRERPDGDVVRWRMAGIERAFGEPALPFFIEWKDRSTYPGGTATYPGVRVARIEVEGDPVLLDAWLGVHALPLEVRPGRARITQVVLATRDDEIVLGGSPAA
jgi:Glyoxalase-like domain